MANKVQLTLGFVSEQVEVKTAVSDSTDTDLKTVCIGEDGNEHAPVRINQIVTCPSCDKTATSHFGFPTKARVNADDTLQVLTAEDLAGAAPGPELTHRIELTSHPLADVERRTLPFGRVYYLTPGKGAGKVYSGFVKLISEQSDRAYCAMFAVRSAPAMYRLRVIDGCLALFELAKPGTVKARPQIDLPEATDADMAVLRQLADLQFGEFDPDKFQDQRKVYLARLLDGIEGVAAGTTGQPVEAVSPFELARAAALAAGRITPAEPEKPAPKKRAPRKKADALAQSA